MQQLTPKVYWETLKERAKAPPVRSDLNAEVIIIGGGMAGLAAADELSRAGKEVIVLEKDYVGAGASGKSSGMICQDSELELTDLIENLGVTRAGRLWEFVGNSMERMRKNILDYEIDCDYQEQDYVYVSNTKRGMKKVYEECKSREKLGYTSRVYTRGNIRELIGGDNYEGALRYPGTFAINSYLYAQGMKSILSSRGVRIFENAPVTNLGNGSVTVGAHTVKAPRILVCVDRFLPRLNRLHKSIYHVETYIMVSKPLSEDAARALFPNGNLMVSDSDIIYQYFRVTGDRRLLIGGGSYLTTYAWMESERPQHIVPKLTRYLKNKFPEFAIMPEYIWPGLLGVSKDLVPIAGQDKHDPTVYYVAGATGLAWAAGLGNYMGEKILHGRDDYDELFDPYRSFPFDPLMRMIQPLITTPMAFGLSHAFVKYLRQIFG
jgi:gamma-glutamylputrescine oxidase